MLEIGLCSGLPTQILVLLALAAVGIAPRPDGQLTLTFVVLLSAIDSLLVGGLVLGLLLRSGESPQAVLMGRRRVIGEGALGLLLIPLVFVIVAIAGLTIARWAPWMHQPDNPFAALLRTPSGLVTFALVGMLAGGVREELQRAFILHRSEQYLGSPLVGLIGFSIVFGLGHLLQGWSAVLVTGLLGLFWGVVYLRRRSVVAPMVSHAAFNLIEVVGFGLLR
jgi:membrane protease YdiL (CAAX protease family)